MLDPCSKQMKLSIYQTAIKRLFAWSWRLDRLQTSWGGMFHYALRIKSRLAGGSPQAYIHEHEVQDYEAGIAEECDVCRVPEYL